MDSRSADYLLARIDIQLLRMSLMTTVSFPCARHLTGVENNLSARGSCAPRWGARLQFRLPGLVAGQRGGGSSCMARIKSDLTHGRKLFWPLGSDKAT